MFKIDPSGNLRILATGLDWPTDIEADNKGYIYISDKKRGAIFCVSAD